MMEALRPFAESGDYIGIWETAKGYGDPLAQLALDFHGSLYGDTFATRVAISKLELAYSGGERLSPELLSALKSTVGRGLMVRHYDELKTDINRSIGIPGILSVKQIDQYHYRYFESIGLPKRTYGGRGVPGIFYCSGCDPVSN